MSNSSITRQTSSAPGQSQPGRAGAGSTTSSLGGQAKASEPAALASEALSAVTDVASQVGARAKQEALSLAEQANEKAGDFLSQQLRGGADLAGQLAGSVKSAADTLGDTAPQLAQLVRGAADKVDMFAHDMREKTPQELWRDVADFTRRQPAVVFGLASVAGFLLFRVLKAAPPTPHVAGNSGTSRSMAEAGYVHGR